MYLLVKRLSRGNILYSVMAGLIFEFAPIKISSVSHLQNISIFYLPLIFLMMLNYFDNKRKKWLIPLFILLVLQFYASWYQMVFVLVAVGLFILCMLLFRVIKPKIFLLTLVTVVLATISTLPLALKYVQFSKTNKATFGIQDATYFI